MAELGTFFGVSTGPGDPELMTFKAARILGACPVVAYFCKTGTLGNARKTAAAHITPEHIEIPMVYPVTVELPHDHPDYGRQTEQFFDESAERIAEHLNAGRNVVILNEGDAFFYGSFMHLFIRLRDRFPYQVIPGVTSVLGSAALLPSPLIMRDDVFSVIPGTLPEDMLVESLEGADAAVVMKLGSNLPKVRRAVAAAKLEDRAWYVEKATMEGQKVMPFRDAPEKAPYFSMIVIPGVGRRA